MTDAYEREQMPGIGEVLLRRKITSPQRIMAMMTGVPLGVSALSGLGLMLLGEPAIGLGAVGLGVTLSALFTLLNVTFASARLVVSEGEFHLQLGMAGPRIAIEEIASVELVRKRSRRRGMGVRSDLQGTTTYQLWGGNESVHIHLRGGKKLVLVIVEAGEIVDALNLALRRRDAPRVRMQALAPDVAAAEALEQGSNASTEQVRVQRR